MHRNMARSIWPIAVCCLTAGLSHASVIYDISMNTAPLMSHAAGPFSLEFQLNDGRGTGDANNTATLSSFAFGGGTPMGLPTVAGGASGNLSSSVNLTDSSFFNQFIQGFTPGSMLKFRLSLTTNVDSGATPDQFSIAILDRTHTEIPTLAGSFFGVFVSIDIDSSNPTVKTFASDTMRSPAAGGPPITIAAPQVTPAAPPVPEPGTTLLFATGLGAIALWRGKRRL